MLNIFGIQTLLEFFSVYFLIKPLYYYKDCDEVLHEIVKCGETLAQLREMNRSHLTTLLERCHIDYRQQIIKNKLEKVNNEVY